MKTGPSPTMEDLARRYLTHRRKLGFSLRIEGLLIQNFARFADQTAPHQPITSALALRWATLPKTSQQRFYHAKRLEPLRGFRSAHGGSLDALDRPGPPETKSTYLLSAAGASPPSAGRSAAWPVVRSAATADVHDLDRFDCLHRHALGRSLAPKGN